ncbi:FYVE, RhoGEF and PH domain-containing protein 6 [Takifugu flavidus]|uniref:FYVE, RhoGEF and PH domain-containing protein 6 n=2 Tax=Takifugu flavidus TaxID=433684 RepID=A0A5C6P875_9TELE|nr:FYVE, RhoGEF and PH domain-containing protein 6 [Takifugu flavidus]
MHYECYGAPWWREHTTKKEAQQRSSSSTGIQLCATRSHALTRTNGGERQFLAWDLPRNASGSRRAPDPSGVIREYRQTGTEVGDAMMRPGMHKPPIAPKPKLVQPQRPLLSPSSLRKDGLSLPSPGTQRRAKPLVAPKPCLSRLSPALESKPLTSQPPHRETQRAEGPLYPQRDVRRENKKPGWDYVIPICLCSKENCRCVGNKSANVHKVEKVNSKTEDSAQLFPKSQRTFDNQIIPENFNKPLQGTFNAERNLRTDHRSGNVRPPVPHRTWSDERNGHVGPQGEPGQGQEEDVLGSERASQPEPLSAGPPRPVPVPRKLRTAALASQEKVEEEDEEITGRDGAALNVKEVKMLLEGKSVSSPSAGAPVEKQPDLLSAGKTCAIPDPPPRKKPLLSVPEKTATSFPQKLPKDAEGGDLGWDSSRPQMQVSLDKGGEVAGKEERDRKRDREMVCTDIARNPTGCHEPPVVPGAVGESVVKVGPKKPPQPSSLMAWMSSNGSSSENQEKLGDQERRQNPADGALKPEVSRTFLTPASVKPSRSSLSKNKSKSFSAADLVRSEGQRKKSFQKLLDLKLKMLPKPKAKADQIPGGAAARAEESVDGLLIYEQTLPSPVIEDEQWVDGDDIYYENMSVYEEIADYINVEIGSAALSPVSPGNRPLLPLPAWTSPAYDDEGIYEEPDQYLSLEENGVQHCPTPSDCERSSVDEEVARLDDGHSDDDILANSSDEEEDSSSVSSKGEAERPEESQTQERQKNKIRHIATEIMTSEAVFVDVLKLLHVDFRGAVSSAARQTGKPVIEERLLNQILYSLPQLYELNQDLLKELELRVSEWEEHAQVADIFLKKGPYLKMYSTYIREYDKNVALLEEQCKRNPAFSAVVREFEASPRCANLALKHYLLKPVQRIPQYQLLLTDYLRNLSEDSDDYKDTQDALVIVKEVANHANDIMKQGDIFQKMFQVQSRLTGHHEIVQPGRIFLKEGVLNKLSRKVMQPRMFFLFNDTLLYTIPVQSGQFKLKNMLSLAGMKVSKPTQEAYQNELNIVSVERSFILSASSASERDEWLEAISKAIDDYTKKKISFISGRPLEEMAPGECGDGAPLGSKAPIWIPDPRATMCMICTCEFTLTWRRHHCRACGKVVCQSCSSNKCYLEYLKNQVARVCDQCFLILRQQNSDQDLSATVSPGNKAPLAFTRKQKRIPAALKEVSASTNSTMSGYLQRSKGNKKHWKRLWFVIKDKVLYTYAASEDVAALESQPLLGFLLKADALHKVQFKLYHKHTLYYIFKADDTQTAQRWIESFREATVL